MAEDYVTLLRIKRKRDEVVQQDLVVEGLTERPKKRAATCTNLANMTLEDDKPELRRFTHLASLPVERMDWTTSQQKLACLLQSFSRDPRSAGEETRNENSSKYRVFDVERPPIASGSNRNAAGGSSAGEKWEARLAGPKGDAIDQPGDVVYDLYTVSEGIGDDAAADYSQAPIVYVHDDLVFANEASDSADECYDSDNPDEEGHHTHDYPDESSGNEASTGDKDSGSSDSSDEQPDWRDEW
ncbi:g4863 [Coccomyxa viridis]|uniref:G4863 protein n=1 Tax=Coccomyxa viridis TaxID=1274662 RepID=A0ABP1FRC3_9CHLO